MSIAEAVQAATAPKLCKFGRILSDLPAPDAQAILDGLEGALSNVDAARILTSNGFPLSEHAVRVHRATDCGCKASA